MLTYCTCQCESYTPRLTQGILTENVSLSEYPPYHELSLSESPPKRSVFLPYVSCQNDVQKELLL